MTKKLTLLCCLTILFSFPSAAEGWLESIKSMFAMDTAEASSNPGASLNVSEMLNSISSSLGVTDEQAEGGVASIMNYVKDNLSASEFNQIGAALPGLSSIMDSAPDIDNLSSNDSLSGVMDQIGSYSDSLKAINDVKKQFGALGLSADMISRYVSQIQNYLNTPQGAEAQKLLMQGVGKLYQSV